VDPSIILAFDEIERQLQKKQSRMRRRQRLKQDGLAA
jgi:ribosome-associated translation inhibitor RaiA